jgi:hypothetical protein
MAWLLRCLVSPRVCQVWSCWSNWPDEACEVAEFVEDGGEEVVVTIGFGAKGGAEEGV